MPPRAEYIQLEPNDDANSVRERLSYVQSRRVLLIWPESGRALNKEVDLVLIQREAKRRNIRIALLTQDPEVIQQAKVLKISAFRTVGESEKKRWLRGTNKVFTRRFDRPQDAPEAQSLMPVASRILKERRYSRIGFLTNRTTITLGILGVIVIAAFALLPGASITVYQARTPITVQENLIADPEVIDANNVTRMIPVSPLRVTSEASGTVESSGRRQIANVPATGKVVFTNQTNLPLDIPANTTVSTSTGPPVLFRTAQDITLPASSDEAIEVDIEAIQNASGSIGNVEVGMINAVVGPLEDKVIVRNISPTSGGDSQFLPVVVADDQRRLLSIVRGQLQSEALAAMQEELSDTEFIVLESIRIAEERDDWTEYSHEVDTISESLSLSMRAVIEAMILDERFIQEIMFAQISSSLPTDQSLLPDSIRYSWDSIQVDDTQIRLTAHASGEMLAEIDTVALAGKLAGKPVEEAVQILLEEPSVARTPPPALRRTPELDWYNQMPLLAPRINIRIASE